MKHYTYLIKNLTPTSELEFYIGVRQCECNPIDDTSYMGSSSLLTEAIGLSGVNNFQKIILEDNFKTREEAEAYELAIHKEYDVVRNPQFYNKKNGTVGFHTTPESIQRQKKTIGDPKWKETVGKEASRKQKETTDNKIWKTTRGKEKSAKQSVTVNSPQWKATIGQDKIEKRKQTINDPAWDDTVGKEQRKKITETTNDPLWKATTGKEKSRKLKETINTPKWKASTGKEQTRKQKETKAGPEWIKENTFTCPRCNRAIQNRGAYNRWHGDNCSVWTKKL